jgi:hypothetical protein
MKPGAPLIVLLCLTSTLAFHPAVAEQLNYALDVVGFPVADASLNIDRTDSKYRASFDFHTRGLANIVDGGRLDETVSGGLNSDRATPQMFASNGYLHGQNRIVDMTWQDGTPEVTQISPPNATERSDVPVALRAGAVDQVSMIVFLLHKVDETGRCDASAHSFDGRDLELFQVRTEGEEDIQATGHSGFSGRALRCAFTSQTLAGFRFGSAGDQDRRLHRGTIWLARVGSGGTRLPVRASVETRWFGDATLYLQSVLP